MKKIVFSLILMIGLANQVWANEYDNYIAEGNRFWADKNVEAAQSAFEKAIKLDPKAAIAHARLAGLLLTNNQNKKAIKAYQNAINADPTNPSLFVAIGIAYLHEGSYSMAKTMVEQALSLEPEHKNGQKLQEYVSKKLEIVAQASKSSSEQMPMDMNHQDVRNKIPPESGVKKPH